MVSKNRRNEIHGEMKNIAVLAGGDSSEYVISERSAAHIIDSVDRKRYNPFLVLIRNGIWNVHIGNKKYPVDLNDFSFTKNKEKTNFDFAFIIIHGTPGEDGKLQSYLEMKNIPYNTSGVLSSALSFNKHVCKNYLKNFGITVPESVIIKKNTEYDIQVIMNKTGLPCFVKPNSGGSSFGTNKVIKQNELEKAINEAFREDNEIIIESYIKGIEVTCGLIKTSDEDYIFPATEIVSKNEFFDFEAKYTVGMADEITPARISDELHKKIQSLASEIYDLLDCRGLVRVDFIIKGNQIYFLELNTVPGMSLESIVPKQIRTYGSSIKEIVSIIIESNLENN